MLAQIGLGLFLRPDEPLMHIGACASVPDSPHANDVPVCHKSATLERPNEIDKNVQSVFHVMWTTMEGHMPTVTAKGIDWIVERDGSISVNSRKLTPQLERNGYLSVRTKLNGKRVRASVHRLIALAYVSGSGPDLTVNHKDGNKLNNRPENLEWVTLGQNTAHQWATGLVNLRGSRHPNARLTEADVLAIRVALSSGETAASLGRAYGVSGSLVHKIKTGARWGHSL